MAALAPADDLSDLSDLTLEGDPDLDGDPGYGPGQVHDTDRPRDTDRPPAFPMEPAPDLLGPPPGPSANDPHDFGHDDDLGLGDLQPSAHTPHAQPAQQAQQAQQAQHAQPPAASASPPDQAPPSAPPPEAVVIKPLPGPPDDDLLAAFTELLRAFPEVEWATYSLASRDGGSAQPAVGMRVIESFRANVDDIIAQLQASARDRGVDLHVLLLDDPELVRSARSLGEVFYPWRRKTRV
jgi:hypothetical protein